MKTLKKEFSPLFLLIAMVFLFCTVTIVGIIHLIIKSIVDTFQWKFWMGPIRFILFWLLVLYQIWNVIKFFFMQIAIGLDMMENVVSGEALEDIITTEEKTMFGNGQVTVSTATGELEYKGKLNKYGVRWTKLLSKVLDENHSVNSYKRYLHNQKFEL